MNIKVILWSNWKEMQNAKINKEHIQSLISYCNPLKCLSNLLNDYVFQTKNTTWTMKQSPKNISALIERGGKNVLMEN